MPPSRRVDADDREAALEDPGVHDPAHRFPGGLLDRVPQVRGLRVPVLVMGHVLPDPRPELLFPEVLLEHPHDRGALLVGEDVEHPLRVGGRDHGVLDGTGRLQGVRVEGAGTGEAEADPPLPLGAVGIGDLELHEGGEGLVEPDAVPPLHRDEIAEPHVRQLVCDHVHDVLQLALGRLVRVGEEEGLPERDAAEVLHGPEGEVGDGDEVHGIARVRDVEVVGEVGERELRHVEAELGEVELVGRAQQPERGARDVDRLGGLERAHDEGHEVGGHRHRVGEADAPTPVEHLVGDQGGVGHRTQVVVEVEGDGEAGFEVRFVPAREGPAGIGGLELGGGDHALDAVVVGEGRAVEPPQLVVQPAPEPE